MASVNEFPARGKITAIKDGIVIFAPSGTNYEVHLIPVGGTYSGPVNSLIEGFIRVEGRKLYSVPSGGNFIAPIFGPPRIIQGRVRFLSDDQAVVQAGFPVIVDLPKADAALDLECGRVAVGGLINVTGLPGATFELAKATVLQI